MFTSMGLLMDVNMNFLEDLMQLGGRHRHDLRDRHLGGPGASLSRPGSDGGWLGGSRDWSNCCLRSKLCQPWCFADRHQRKAEYFAMENSKTLTVRRWLRSGVGRFVVPDVGTGRRQKPSCPWSAHGTCARPKKIPDPIQSTFTLRTSHQACQSKIRYNNVDCICLTYRLNSVGPMRNAD